MTITYLYDNLNRMTRKTVPTSASGAVGYSVFYGYDLRNLQTDARFGSLTGNGIDNDFDAFGRLTSSLNTTGGTSRQIQYEYDTGSRRSRLIVPDTTTYFRYEYDPYGRLLRIFENADTSAVAAFTYGNAGPLWQASVSGG